KHRGGAFSFICGNITPEKTEIQIDIKYNGELVGNIRTTELKKYSFELPAGIIIFEAKHILEMEQTGEPYDIGGWFQFENLLPL
ncbi:MAG: hypothetical protein ACP5KS_09730, partial [Candidatus Hydrogenedens sp.]